MKTKQVMSCGWSRPVIPALGLVLVLALGGGDAWGQAGSAKGGGARQIELMRIDTPKDLEKVEPGDMVAVTCPKCESVHVTYVQKEIKGGVTRTVHADVHQCPGCGTQAKTKGFGKNKRTVFVHRCAHCGSEKAFCCVLKKDQAAPGKEEGK